MILIIDNYDSFTYNIVQYCKELGANLKVVRNDELSIAEIYALNPSKIILSPGPSEPKDAGVTLDVIKEFSGKIPLLGICLGHQAIGEAFGAKVVRAAKLMHGKTSNMNICKESIIFKDMPQTFKATRYHSLVIEKNTIPNTICPTAYSDDDDEIMALEIPNMQVYGVQFHPESILSEYGYTILANFLNID